MVTQKDVAKKAGVSFITVSRVINDQGNVQDETRQRVLKAIRELDYHPNHLGQALNSGKNNTIGVMTPIRFQGGLEANMYLIGVLDGIEHACRENHRDLLLSTEDITDSSFDFLHPYHQRKVDGLVFLGLQNMDPGSIQEIENGHIPCVVIGDRPVSNGISWVDSDNETGGYLTGKRMLELGHRKIAFVGVDPVESRNLNIKYRFNGLKRAMLEAGVPWDDRYHLVGDFIEDSGVEVFKRLLASGLEMPSAIFCGTDAMALGIIHQARDSGLRVPEDLSVVGFDGFPLGQHMRPVLTSNQQPLKQMGAEAVTLLLQYIANPDLARENRIFPITFLPGETLAGVPH